MKFNQYQQNIFDTYQTTSKNIFINATAGAGKTTTLVELAKRTPPTKEAIFLAFNKSIAKELGNRLPKFITASTLHSCALSMLRSAFKIKFQINENKYFAIGMDALMPKKNNVKAFMSSLYYACEIYNLMRYNCTPCVEEDIFKVAERYGVLCSDETIELILKLQAYDKKEAEKAFTGKRAKIVIDFTDMLCYAVNYVNDNKRYNVVMVDEVQDLSLLQYALIKKLKTSYGRMISVGDKKQAIYSFQGSNLDTLQNIENAQNTVSLPLSITYRCSKCVVDEANKVFPNEIFAAMDAIDGEIIECGKLVDAENGDFILCRNNAPLVKAFIKFIKCGKKCSILGKDFGDELINLINNVTGIYEFENMLVRLESKLKAKGIQKPMNSEIYRSLDEKVNILIDLYNYFGDLNTVRNRMHDIFTDESNGVVLSTIHKSKGLEANNVYFLNQELIPSKYATTELAKYSEKCLKFVGITRSKNKLIYCNI